MFRLGLLLPGSRAGRAVLVAACLPALFWVVVGCVHGDVGAHGWLGFDFRTGVLRGAQHMLDGRSPYELPYLRANQVHPPTDFSTPAYPAPGMLLGIPFTALPVTLANVLVVLLLLPVPALALRLLGISDWRCHALAYASLPTINALEFGTMSPVMLLAAAAAWRLGNGARGGLALGAAIVLKLFLWPLVVVLAATRRLREAAIALACCAIAALGWLAVSPSTLSDYVEVNKLLAAMQQQRGLSLVAFGGELGLPASAARVLAVAIGAGLLAAAVWLGREPGGAARGYAVAVCAALALSPIVWNHYLVLALVPLALLSPGYSWHWWVAWAAAGCSRRPRRRVPGRDDRPAAAVRGGPRHGTPSPGRCRSMAERRRFDLLVLAGATAGSARGAPE